MTSSVANNSVLTHWMPFVCHTTMQQHFIDNISINITMIQCMWQELTKGVGGWGKTVALPGKKRKTRQGIMATDMVSVLCDSVVEKSHTWPFGLAQMQQWCLLAWTHPVPVIKKMLLWLLVLMSKRSERSSSSSSTNKPTPKRNKQKGEELEGDQETDSLTSMEILLNKLTAIESHMEDTFTNVRTHRSLYFLVNSNMKSMSSNQQWMK